MLTTLYSFVVEHHDWFQHYGAVSEPQENVFDNLQDAFKAWKKSKAEDFCWPSDHERITSRLSIKRVYVVDRQPKHGYVRGHKLENNNDLPFNTLEPWYRRPQKKKKQTDEVEELSDSSSIFEDISFKLDDELQDDTLYF